MRFAAKLAVAAIANALALLAAAYIVGEFSLEITPMSLLVLALILTVLNFFLKPVLKLILGPLIILTLGLGLILVNMIILYVLDTLSNSLTIESVSAMIYASLIIGLVNFTFHLATKG